MEPFLALYESCRQDVYAYLAGLTRDAALAEELTSETFCAALAALPRFRGDAQVKTWLFTIARNKWLDHLRRAAPVTDVELAGLYLADERPGPAQRAEQRDAARRALALLENEPERTRRIVLMRIQGYSFYEIGRATGMREGSARVIDFRARAKLRALLEQEGYDETL